MGITLIELTELLIERFSGVTFDLQPGFIGIQGREESAQIGNVSVRVTVPSDKTPGARTGSISR